MPVPYRRGFPLCVLPHECDLTLLGTLTLRRSATTLTLTLTLTVNRLRLNRLIRHGACEELVSGRVQTSQCAGLEPELHGGLADAGSPHSLGTLALACAR